jgi:hypothetical protein
LQGVYIFLMSLYIINFGFPLQASRDIRVDRKVALTVGFFIAKIGSSTVPFLGHFLIGSSDPSVLRVAMPSTLISSDGNTHVHQT